MAQPKAIEKKESNTGIQSMQWEIIGKQTPKQYIMTRPGPGGKKLDYVQTGYIIELLNKTFNGMWDFEVVNQEIGKGQVWVQGKLTCKIIDKNGELHTITKTQYGGSDIKVTKESKSISIADDLKTAASDCLKKCASMLGFASDIYWGGEHLGDTDATKTQETTASATSTIAPAVFRQCPIHQVQMKQYDKNGHTWFSHMKEDGTWCNGTVPKPKPTQLTVDETAIDGSEDINPDEIPF